MFLKHNQTVYSYVTVIVLTLLIILVGSQGIPIIGKVAAFLFFIAAVTFGASVGGLKTGILVTAISSLAAFLNLFADYQFNFISQILPLYEILVFILAGGFISYTVEKYKKTNLENEYFKKEKETLKLVKKLEEENIKAKQEIKVRDEFLSIASHELKTPLTTMLLKIQLILHNIRNVSLAKFSVENLLTMLETAEQQTQRLSRMITDLLSISVITTGRLNIEFSKFNLGESVKQVISEFSERLQKDGYELNLRVPEQIIIMADKIRIEQVITNLISNAIKYGDKNPIEVKVEKSGSLARIIVKDHGVGIGSAEKEKIFELFERGVMKESDIKGLGVGLFISNQIVKSHKGTIKVDSKINHGSTFTVEIPLKQS